MPGNEENEPVDLPNNRQPEHSPEEIILINDNQTINPNQETDNMEVHHHAHHEHGKKNWKSYFWEFLMLFLAVFSGFLAENQREHYIENKREKKYIESLIQDLKADTTSLEEYIRFRTKKRIYLDSLVLLLSTGQYKKMGNETYFFARQVYNASPFVSTDGTMQQLKNAGNLRLIHGKAVTDSILSYDQTVRALNEWDEVDTRIKTSFREIGGTLFSSSAFYKTIDSEMNFLRPTTNPQIITDDPAIINNVSFQIQYLSTVTQGNLLRAKSLKKRAINLIDLLKQEYHLK
jgi:hypothetical protein